MTDFIFLAFIIVVPVIIVKLLDLFLFKKLFKEKNKNDTAQIVSYILTILLIAICKKYIYLLSKCNNAEFN